MGSCVTNIIICLFILITLYFPTVSLPTTSTQLDDSPPPGFPAILVPTGTHDILPTTDAILQSNDTPTAFIFMSTLDTPPSSTASILPEPVLSEPIHPNTDLPDEPPLVSAPVKIYSIPPPAPVNWPSPPVLVTSLMLSHLSRYRIKIFFF